ncbi:MAG: bifunctional phosphopantothenoylcysteine decarboxylase/phosphopantothenate--cysteine ligase CoaBC [Anaerolineales bacterium]|jgi:phosphopantothenoylcysteine decarboxylase/phosphopantothenate--cysteine ligase
MSIFTSKHILLGVTGSIAAYKSADLASKLTQAGAQVDVILTPAAQKFISPLTFQSVTGRKAFTDADLWGGEAHVLHVGLGQSADLLVIAPCTANTIGKLAHGLADNLLTITALAMRSSILIAPAMDAGMFEHPVTQENIHLLSERGIHFAGPDEGHMASGLSGRGRMVEPAELMGHIRLILGKGGKLAGKKIVVTAGGTQEPLDPVRMLSNKSSGKQGYAIVQAALDAGGSVVLITALTSLTSPVGAQVIQVRTAQEMQEAVLKEAKGSAALVMAAAVADFRPKTVAKNKLKKLDGIPQVELEAAPDILLAVANMRSKKPQVVIGFAAESKNLIENASRKLKSKKLDILVANDISAPDAGFSVDTNRVTLLFPNAKAKVLPLMSKSEVAETLITHLGELLENR